MRAFGRLQPSSLFLYLLFVVTPSIAADKPDELAAYYSCVKSYALKFAKTSAPASDVADAALSACSDAAKALRGAIVTSGTSMESADRLTSNITEVARRFAIRSLLEARFEVK